MKRKVFVVPHSHWDREWYFSIEDSNTLLTENLDFLTTYLEKHSEFPTYTFDGQSSLIDEYLSIKPEQEPIISKLISDSRIQIGPWYTQCDTLLIQTESIIRNLLLGQRQAEKYGKSMSIGYLPDIFGQNAYLPAIFQGFGIKNSVLQRGIYDDQLAEDLTFSWISPNGDQVLANNIYFGYGPGKFLNDDAFYLKQTLLPILDKLAEKTAADNPLLLPAGGDQVLIRTAFPKIVERLNQLDLPYEFVLSNYEDFMSKTKNLTSTMISGELIASQKSRIHQTIRSQRIDIKLLNSKVEEKIYQQLEPLAVMSEILGGNYPYMWINKSLKLLFDVHAHDSIGGCNSDETNAEIVSRLKRIERIIDDYINILKKQLSRGIVKNDGDVVLFNLLPKKLKKVMNVIVFTPYKNVCLENGNNREISQVILEQEYLSGGKTIKVTAEGEQQVELPGYYRTKIALEVSFEGFGYQTYHVAERAESNVLVKLTAETIENQFYRISIDDGAIVLCRKSDDEEKREWFKFENTADAGDSYDYSPLENNKTTWSQNSELIKVEISDLIKTMTIQTKLAVAKDINNAGEFNDFCTIETKITLENDSDVIHLTHSLNNQAEDHRIRVLFSGDNKEGFSFGDQGYSVQKRKNVNKYLKNWKDLGFAESPQPIYPLERFVCVDEKKGNVTLFTKGLKEYEAQETFLALTLFRSVGLLGKDDLSWRPGRASGINNKIVYTPDAQMKGDLTFSYGYRWQEGTHNIEDIYRAAEKYSISQLAYQLQALNSFEERVDRFELPQPEGFNHLSNDQTFLTIQPDLFVTALKKSEDQQDYLLRIFNPSETTIDINYPIKNAKVKNLAEKDLELKLNQIREFDFKTVSIKEILKREDECD